MPTFRARAAIRRGGRIGPAGASPDQVVGRADRIDKRLRPPEAGGRKCAIWGDNEDPALSLCAGPQMPLMPGENVLLAGVRELAVDR